MFGLFKQDPKAKLEKEYAELLTKAVDAQRNGKIELYAQLTVQSEEVLRKIEALEASKRN
jgi:molybdenum-dependent DNA-binding transcriptional regulator ModE